MNAAVKALPTSVHSSMRSGVVLFDLTSVVQELVFNSVDAGAKKVSVLIGIGTCYVKVVDDGSGITRDGLVLLGERYTTSKDHQVDHIHSSGSFGSRGEALASISDIAILEIITKAHGRPNGYRKVLKGCKCLHLGIDDGRKDTGTTIVVHDLFYNQPIRRKSIQSSSKKALDSVKKSVFHIAIVRPDISFQVVDVESNDELLCTYASPTPLSILRSFYGNEISSSLHEVNAHEGSLKLTGYLSGPLDCVAVKAFQHAYVNSRLICKSPIHKLVNQVAMEFECLNAGQNNDDLQRGKRSRSSTCPSYILKLNCPFSLYDLSCEPSKTIVEFKDWIPILAFIEKEIQHLWRLISGRGKHTTVKEGQKSISKEADLLEDSELARKKSRLKNDQGFFTLPSFLLEMPGQEDNKISNENNGDHYEIAEFAACGSEMDLLRQDAFSLKKCDYSFGKRMLDDTFNDDGYKWLPNSSAQSNRSGFAYVEDGGLERGIGMQGRSESIAWSDYVVGSSSKRTLQRLCSSRENMGFKRTKFAGDDGFDFSNDGFGNKQQQFGLYNDSHFQTYGPSKQGFTSFSRALWQDEVRSSIAQPTAKCTTRENMFVDSDFLFSDSPTPISSYTQNFIEENGLSSNNFVPVQSAGSGRWSSVSDWISDLSNQFRRTSRWKCLGDDNLVETREFSQRGGYWPLLNWEDVFTYDYIYKSPIRADSKGWASQESCKDHCTEARGPIKYECSQLSSAHKARSRRSHSAPPYFRKRRKFISLCPFSLVKPSDPDAKPSRSYSSSLGAEMLKRPNLSDSMYGVSFERGSAETFIPRNRPDTDKMPNHNSDAYELDKDATSGIIQDSRDYESKWRDGYLEKRGGTSSQKLDEGHILEVTSGILHLGGGSLIPKSISRNCLVSARVLQQVDKKFIPVVAGGTLAVIDQHAADERIRLEELRRKVFSGEAKTVSYLESEKELSLPEMGCQLLHNYGQQIQEWGWICNIHAQGSRSFRNNINLLGALPTVVTLLAVPCILGVNLTDLDLLEYLQQLADTDGASKVPPAVLRILNYKACRGAIMFGDSLLLSECSLIVHELKQTSLCFQCAHGRPTTVPLVNLEELHKQINGVCTPVQGSNDMWRGLHRCELSLERAEKRLAAASREY